jgi:hypothetical protein
MVTIEVTSTRSASIGIYLRNAVGRCQVEHATTAAIMICINVSPDGAQ